MINKHLDDIASLIKEDIVNIEKMRFESSSKMHYVIYTPNNKYMCKIIKYSDESYKIHNMLKNNEYDYLPKIIGTIKDNNYYLIIMKWIGGVKPNIYFSKDNIDAELEDIKKIAFTLKKMHKEFEYVDQENLSKSLINNIKRIQDCTYKYKDKIVSYFINNVKKIDKQKKSLIHGDFHRDNIIINNKIVFIDLDDMRYDNLYKDLIYAANLHKAREEDMFYYFLLQFYFDFNIPRDFWNIVNCYSILKIIDIMNKEKQININHQAKIRWEDFVSEHENMNQDVPTWFLETDRKVKQLLKIVK